MNRTAAVDWQAVYADLLPRVYNFFRYRVQNRSTAEDLTATTLEKAWSGRARYRRDGVDYRLSAPLDVSTNDLVRMAESLR